MEENEQDRSEQPTPFKLRRAREKGTVARGMDLGFLTGLSAFLVYAWIAGPEFGQRLTEAVRIVFGIGPMIGDGNSAVLALIPPLFTAVAQPIAMMAVAVLLVTLLFEIVQTGVVFWAQPLKPDFSRLNPAKGLKC